MSWFSEIAGKAEDLLNKVDKTTATVLQSKASNDGFSSDVSFKRTFPLMETDGFKVSPLRSYQASSKSSNSNDFNSSSRTYAAVKKKNSLSDEEKLIEFLNSSEPLPQEARKRKKEKSPSFDSRTLEKVKESGDLLPEVKVADKSETVYLKESDATKSEDVDSASKEDDEQISKLIQNVETDLCIEPENFPAGEKQQEQHFDERVLPVGKKKSHSNSSSPEISTGTMSVYSVSEQAQKSEFSNIGLTKDAKLVRTLKERESDLKAALGAKDSQLAVLKVLLEKGDQELHDKRIILQELKSENERLFKNYNEEVSIYNQTIENLRQQVLQTEMELSKSRENYHAVQTEHITYVSRMEEENRHLAENVTNLQRKLMDSNEKNREMASTLQNANRNLESLQQEYADYKQKAQRILQSKDKLISSLKEGCLNVESLSCSKSSYAVLSAEAEAVKQERDLLLEELRKANDTIERCRREIQEVEEVAQNDSNTAQEHHRNLEEQLVQERMIKEEIQLLNTQLKEEIKFLQEEIIRSKNNFQTRIDAGEQKVEKLCKQLLAKSLNTVSQNELESRLHALTENLIQKQTMVEALSTEKNSLVLQLERLEQQLKEMQMHGAQHHTVIGVSNTEIERKQKLFFSLENPFDSNLTRKVKRVYGSIDAFSIRSGVFFRRYPVARMFVLMYMLLLHLWVMIVLLTYEPEIHSAVNMNKA